eukprot:12909973-Alexandrium_andersonii.AAC.1
MARRCNEGKSESRNSPVQARSGRAGLCSNVALDTETDLDSGRGKQSEGQQRTQRFQRAFSGF